MRKVATVLGRPVLAQPLRGRGGPLALVATRTLCSTPPQTPPTAYTDINERAWTHRLLPEYAWPYAALGRWDRPIGTWLLLWPCYWSTALAAPAGALPDASLLALFGVGAFAMRGAGCTINDLWDRDIDRQVERTRGRPLASGALGVPQALGFLTVQLTAGLSVLLSLPPYAVGVGLCSVPFFSLYPLAKRYTDYPQAVLGLTFNWGALMGAAAVHGSAMSWAAVLPLYAGGFWWTMLYDTIYAHQDKDDDVRVGVRSTALTFGEDKRFLAAFGASSIACLAGAGAAANLHPVYHVLLLGGGSAHLAWQTLSVDLGSRADCLRKFQSNHTFGALIFAAIVLGKLLADQQQHSDDASDAAPSGSAAHQRRHPADATADAAGTAEGVRRNVEQ